MTPTPVWAGSALSSTHCPRALVVPPLSSPLDRARSNDTLQALIDTEWVLWMIDHSRAFQVHEDLRYGDEIVWCSPRMWELLQQVTDNQIRAAIDAYLASEQMSALLERRALLVEHIQKMIDERGRGSVIF